MSIERQGREVVFHCDSCADFIETEETDFNDAFNTFRANNWKAVKIGTEWTHKCPVCVEGAAQAKR